MTISEFIKEVNDLRKQNKNKWVAGVFTVEGQAVGYKAYGTWVQRIERNGIRDGNSQCSVKDFNKFLNDFLAIT
jgi:pantothenate kinase-related protein Tda10